MVNYNHVELCYVFFCWPGIWQKKLPKFGKYVKLLRQWLMANCYFWHCKVIVFTPAVIRVSAPGKYDTNWKYMLLITNTLKYKLCIQTFVILVHWKRLPYYTCLYNHIFNLDTRLLNIWLRLVISSVPLWWNFEYHCTGIKSILQYHQILA